MISRTNGALMWESIRHPRVGHRWPPIRFEAHCSTEPTSCTLWCVKEVCEVYVESYESKVTMVFSESFEENVRKCG